MKKCYKCGETKDLTQFNKDNRAKDGHQSKCKACRKQYRENNKDKKRHYDKQYREDNKEKLLKYYQDNKDYNAAYKKQRILNAMPCVYRIKSKTSGIYYIGSTTHPLCDRVTHHFSTTACKNSFFTGKDKSNWEWHELFIGSKEEVRELEKYMLSTRVGKDKNCINLRVG